MKICAAAILMAALLLSGCGIRPAQIGEASSGQEQLSGETTPAEVTPEVTPTEPAAETAAAPETAAEATSEPAAEAEAPMASAPELPEERKAVSYTLTFAGDCTLGDELSLYQCSKGFLDTVGSDYDWPFSGVKEYFENDDATIVNLEVVLGLEGSPQDKIFRFHAPTEYVQCLTGSSVEVVTTANNHTLDFGKTGYAGMSSLLTENGVTNLEQRTTLIYTTESGLTIGFYAENFIERSKNTDYALEQIAWLRQQAVDVVICAFHWGEEGYYRPIDHQKNLARAAIDAGANIIYGCHSHVLQPIEEYNGGIIYYSLGNFAYGGIRSPYDYDTAIIRQEIIVEPDGTVCLGTTERIPCCMSSRTNGANDYRPVPYEEGSEEWNRVLSKLDGSYSGANFYINREGSSTESGSEETPEPEQPAEPQNPESGEGGSTEPDGTGEQPSDHEGGTGGTEGGNESSGDNGNSGSGESGTGGSETGSGGSGETVTPPAENSGE